VLLILTGYSMAPWVLLAPLHGLKLSLGQTGVLLHFIGVAVLWFWTTVLFFIAIQKTYRLSVDRVLLMSAVPLLMALLGYLWTFTGLVGLIALFQ
jgi:hypothetical protein